MRNIGKLSWLGGLSFSVVVLVAGVSRAETKAAATIIAPQTNSIVGRLTEVVFEATQPGIPLVFVAAEDETVEWWVQPLAKKTESGRYVVAAHFGNAKSPQGKPFHVVVVMVPSERTAAMLAKQQVFPELPKNLAASRPVRVLRRFESETTLERAVTVTASREEGSAAVRIVGLEDRAQVARLQQVRGVLVGPLDPVILVRAAAANSTWWVQEPVQRKADGEFTALVRFGNEKTPEGSEFQMIVVTPRSSSQAELLKVGDDFKELPRDAPVSAKMTFVLSSDKATGAE